MLAVAMFGAANSVGIAQVPLNREDAMNFPSRHAWNLFLLLNHPAKDPKSGERGIADLSKKIGAAATTTVWETWREATPEVFKADGSRPPNDFNEMTLISEFPNAKVPEPSKKRLIAALNEQVANIGTMRPLFNPVEGIGQPGEGGFGETRMNKSTYDFILRHNLYNVGGQAAYAKEVIAGTKPPISFDVESMEVKAAWKELTPDQLAKGDEKRYYLAEYNGKKYGLATLHIITKDVPNWFWTSFHHKDSPGSGFETPDKFGQPSSLKGTVWENYVLSGTQTDFVDSVGRPTLLSDGYIEQDFLRSSCISCHARATRAPDGGRLGSVPDVGVPSTALFFDSNGKLLRAQMDFLFSLAARAQPQPTPQ